MHLVYAGSGAAARGCLGFDAQGQLRDKVKLSCEVLFRPDQFREGCHERSIGTSRYSRFSVSANLRIKEIRNCLTSTGAAQEQQLDQVLSSIRRAGLKKDAGSKREG